MMFDPPDYPYRELSETYDELLLTKNNTNIRYETIPTNDADHSLLESNIGGRYFNMDNVFLEDTTNILSQSTELCVVQSENLLNCGLTLLDENTVNQFLLPPPDSAQNNDQTEISSGPDSLALHSCVVCHDIFTTESDLLDHTIAFHASMNIKFSDDTDESFIVDAHNSILLADTHTEAVAENTVNVDAALATEWLVCRICERVLSTALGNEPKEQLCCVDINGRCSVSTRKLSAMFVCDACSGLFADGDALDKHKAQGRCFIDDASLCDQVLPSSELPCPEECFSCNTCGAQYSSADDLNAHIVECMKRQRPRRTRAFTTNNTNKMWNCGSCNQLFTTARELYRHKRGEDRPEGTPLTAYVCEECDKVLGSMCALHTHKKMHKVSKPGYPCRICGRRFNQSGHLAIHMRMHTGERPYPCDLCPKAFKVKMGVKHSLSASR